MNMAAKTTQLAIRRTHAAGQAFFAARKPIFFLLPLHHGYTFTFVMQHQLIPTALPPWVASGTKSLDERCMEWEGQRWVTPTHLYLFKYTDLSPPWFEPLYQVYVCPYKLPQDHQEKEIMLAMLTAEPEMNWKPFVTVLESARSDKDTWPSTRFVLMNDSLMPVLYENPIKPLVYVCVCPYTGVSGGGSTAGHFWYTRSK